MLNKKNKNPFTILNNKSKGEKLNTIYRSDWSEDTYISDSKIKETVNNNFDYSRIPIAVTFIILMIGMLISKIAWLQIIKGKEYRLKAEGNRIRTERIEPKRGIIYDRNMNPLVRNKANFMLYFIPYDLYKNKNQLADIFNEIKTILPELNFEKINNKLNNIDKKSLDIYSPLFIIDNIEYEKAMELYLKASSWAGVVLKNKSNRDYLIYRPKDNNVDLFFSMSHILGYTGKINKKELEQFGNEYSQIDYIGKMGIEYFWENELKGKSGKKYIEVDALENQKKIIKEVLAEDGNNLVISIDINQQIKLEEILKRHLKKLGLTRSVGIIVNPKNGEILAMVSTPSYDNNQFAKGITIKNYNILINHKDKPLFNRCISGEYPSGSIIKPVIAVSALQEKIISENTSFFSTGGIRIGQWFFPDWRAGGHGRVNVQRAIAESVNTFFYYIGGGYENFNGLGVEKIVEYGKLFGLGAQTGIDLAGESSGFLPTREWKKRVKDENWYIGDTYHLAIGQGDLLVTPLQAVMFTSVFANNGKLFRPHFIKYILSSDDKIIKENENKPVREGFIDDYNLLVIKKGMRRTITSGSARSLQSLPVAVAGKTGTAQWSTKKETHAWFTGFAPYDDPELVFVILVEEGGEGSSTAVPIVKDYLNWYFNEYKK